MSDTPRNWDCNDDVDGDDGDGDGHVRDDDGFVRQPRRTNFSKSETPRKVAEKCSQP